MFKPSILRSGGAKRSRLYISDDECSSSEQNDSCKTDSGGKSLTKLSQMSTSTGADTPVVEQIVVAPLVPKNTSPVKIFGKAKKHYDEKAVIQRLMRCDKADADTLTCLNPHCQRAFKEAFTLAFHLSYSHIGDTRSQIDVVCLLCGKVFANGRSLILHSQLSHRDVSLRHSDEMRTLSRLVDCYAAANLERIQTFNEKTKIFDATMDNFRIEPSTAAEPPKKSKTRVLDIPISSRRIPSNIVVVRSFPPTSNIHLQEEIQESQTIYYEEESRYQVQGDDEQPTYENETMATYHQVQSQLPLLQHSYAYSTNDSDIRQFEVSAVRRQQYFVSSRQMIPPPPKYQSPTPQQPHYDNPIRLALMHHSTRQYDDQQQNDCDFQETYDALNSLRNNQQQQLEICYEDEDEGQLNKSTEVYRESLMKALNNASLTKYQQTTSSSSSRHNATVTLADMESGQSLNGGRKRQISEAFCTSSFDVDPFYLNDSPSQRNDMGGTATSANVDDQLLEWSV